MHLMRALALAVSEVHVSNSAWNMVLMALVKTLEDLYVFFVEYTGIELGEFEKSDWEGDNNLVN
jgi:hypothetical protein